MRVVDMAVPLIILSQVLLLHDSAMLAPWLTYLLLLLLAAAGMVVSGSRCKGIRRVVVTLDGAGVSMDKIQPTSTNKKTKILRGLGL